MPCHLPDNKAEIRSQRLVLITFMLETASQRERYGVDKPVTPKGREKSRPTGSASQNVPRLRALSENAGPSKGDTEAAAITCSLTTTDSRPFTRHGLLAGRVAPSMRCHVKDKTGSV